MFEYIFTIGYFDTLHKGHIRLLEKLNSKCNKLIIGIHNTDSIEKKTDIQTLDVRKKNIEKYAFDIFVINSLDPTETIMNYIKNNSILNDSLDNTKNLDNFDYYNESSQL